METPIRGTEKIVALDKSLPIMQFSDYPGLKQLASRWTSTGLENHYLRFNSQYDKEELKTKIAEILNIPESKIAIYDTPFLGTVPII